MGNVNGREDDDDGSNSPSIVEENGREQDSMLAGDGVNVQNRDSGDGDDEFLGQSPPSSPRTSQSPLMFRPQMPVEPLPRPDGVHTISSLDWINISSGYEDMYYEQGIPTMFTWSYGGRDVALEGSWDNWKSRTRLERSGKDFTIVKVLPSGFFHYRFIVDGQWRHALDMPWIQDEAGTCYNTLDLKEFVPDDIESVVGFEPPQSPDSSYNNTKLGPEDYAKEPPIVPPHLQMTTLLDVPSSQMDMESPLSPTRPNHVVLNHLYMQKGRNSPSVVTLGSTHRFLSKYVTVMLYKSIQ